MKYVLLVIMMLLISYLPYQSNGSSNESNYYSQLLYSPLNSTTTFLIEKTGEINHTWESSYFPGVAVWWPGDGTIIRTINVGFSPPIGGAGGGVQKIEWDGTVIWDFQYTSDNYCSHHDVKTLPDGNLLMIAWEKKTYAEAIEAGRNPDYVSPSQGLIPDYIIEVKPTGATTGEIVWEWHAWDHLIQEYDCSKANYGFVKFHPELIDINYQTIPYPDWMHTNSIDYNEDFDQILLSVRYFNEIWIIDHSTTTQEAAGHCGGNSGKGGDLLYRWGNPLAYQRGTIDDQKLFYQHDATWIDEGYPGEGNILIYNNGNYRPGDNYTSVDEIIPPVNTGGKYYLKTNESYEPKAQTWIYTAYLPTSFYTPYVGGAKRLPNGNTLISSGATGEIFEVTPEKKTVWQYYTGGPFFKAVYITLEEEPETPDIPDIDCTGALTWTNIKPGSIISGSFQVQNIGDPHSKLNWKINTSSISWGTWTYNPESGQGLIPEDGKVTVQVSVISPNEENKEFDGYIRIENTDNPEDFSLINVYLKTPRQRTFSQIFFNFLEQYPKISSIIQKLLIRLVN